jgi:hypothetical protein
MINGSLNYTNVERGYVVSMKHISTKYLLNFKILTIMIFTKKKIYTLQTKEHIETHNSKTFFANLLSEEAAKQFFSLDSITLHKTDESCVNLQGRKRIDFFLQLEVHVPSKYEYN